MYKINYDKLYFTWNLIFFILFIPGLYFGWPLIIFAPLWLLYILKDYDHR